MEPASETGASFFIHSSLRRDYGKVLVIALAYFAAHRIAFFFPDAAEAIMVVWPAGGIGLAAFLLIPRRLWPGLTLALFISGVMADVLLGGRSIVTGIGYMTGNMAESIGCAWLIIRSTGDFMKFTRVREVLALIAGAVLVNAMSSCIGAATSVLTRGASFVEEWQSWYIADGLGLLVIGPLIVVWMSKGTNSTPDVRSKKVVEFLACMIVWSFFSLIVFYPLDATAGIYPHPYILVALLAWPAIRLGQRGVTTALVLLFAIAILSPVNVDRFQFWRGMDPSSYSDHRLLELQLFLGFLAVVGYLMAAGYSGQERAKEALTKNIRQYDDLTSHISVGIYLIRSTPDGAMKFEYVSPRIAQMLNVSVTSILADANAAFRPIHPDDLPALRELNRRHIRECLPFDWEGRALVNGEVLWLHIASTPEAMDDGAILWHGIVDDITERVRENNQLQSSEERFRAIWEKSFDGMRLTDNNGIMVMVNAVFCEQVGKTRDELEDRPLDVMYDSGNGKRILAATIDRFRNKTVVPHFERQLTLWNGRKVWFELSNSIVELGSGSQFLLSIFRDVTARKLAEEALKASEEKLKTLINTMSEGMALNEILCNDRGEIIDYRIVEVNEAFYRVADIQPGQVLGSRATELYQMSPDFIRAFWESHKDKKEIQHTEMVSPINNKRYSVWTSPIVNNKFVTSFVDITEHKLAEEALRASEERYERITKAITDYIYTVRVVDGRVVKTSHGLGCLTVTGYQPDEFVNDPYLWVNMVVPEDRPNVEEQAQRILAGENPLPIEHRIVHKNGTVRWVRNTFVLHRDQNGAIASYDGLIQDISEQKRTEQLLADELNYSQTIFEASPIGIITYKDTGETISANSAAAAMVGATIKQLRAQNFREIKSWKESGLFETANAALASGNEKGIEFHLISTFGNELWMSARLVPFIHQGRQELLTLLSDITERKQSEEMLKRYRLLSENTRDIILYIRASDLQILEANNAALHAYGYSREELLTKSLRDLRDPETLDDIARQLDTAAQEGILFESLHRRRDGSTFPVEVSSRGMTHGNDRILLSIIRDISGRKQEEAKAAQLVAIVESSDDVIMSKTLDGVITSWNGGAENIYGYSASEMIGKPVSILLPPDRADEMVNILKKIKSGSRLVHYETVRQKKDGQCIDMSLTVSPIKDKEGNIIGASTIGRDITDRKRVEEALRESQLRYRAIIEQSNDGIGISDLQGRYVLVNQAFCKMTRYSEEELLRMHVIDLVPKTTSLKLFNQVVNSAKLEYRETELLRKDGTTFVAFITGSSIQVGKNRFVQGIVRDVTERKQSEETIRESEERYRSIIQASPDNITIANLDGRIIMISPIAVPMFGFEREEQVRGHSIFDFIVPEDRNRALSNITRRLQGALPTSNEYRGLRNDGSTFDIEVNSDFIKGPDGQPTQIVRSYPRRYQAQTSRRGIARER